VKSLARKTLTVERSREEEERMARKTKSVHVVPNKDGGWDIKSSGAARSSGHFDRKVDAVKRAREISRNKKSELVIHNKDGKIAQKDSHGHDPRDIKG
jgi:hypothetical protein